MTEPTDFDATEAALPGLEPAPASASALQLATRRTIVALERAGLVGEQQAMICRLLIDLADVVDAGRRQGKASAAAMAGAQMLAAYAALVPENAEGGEQDAWSELVADLRRGAAAVRNEAQS